MAGREVHEFPPAYLEIAEHFVKARTPLKFNMTLQEANAVRRDLYRFFNKIKEQADLGDNFCQHLLPGATELSVAVKPSKGAPESPVTLVVKKHPMAMSLYESLWGEKEDKTPAEEVQEEDGLIDLTGLDDILKQMDGTDGQN